MSQTENTLQLNGRENLWSRAVAMETGIQVGSCYQCLRCTNGCPMSGYMDVKPHQIVRMVQLGQSEKLFESSSIWLCLSCEMCSTYCPNQIDVAGLMDHLKHTVASSGKKPAEFEVAAFHQTFMDVLQRHGRMHDLQLIQLFKLKTLMNGQVPAKDEMLADASLALGLLKRHRLNVLPGWNKRSAKEIRRVIKQHCPKGGPA